MRKHSEAFHETMNFSLESKTLQFLLPVSWAQLGGQKVAPTTCHLCIPKCDIVLSSPLPLEEADGGWWILGWALVFPWAVVHGSWEQSLTTPCLYPSVCAQTCWVLNSSKCWRRYVWGSL